MNNIKYSLKKKVSEKNVDEIKKVHTSISVPHPIECLSSRATVHNKRHRLEAVVMHLTRHRNVEY